MDTSEGYVKMCDCSEIQGFRYYQESYFNWKAGDWYISIRPKHSERVGPLIWSEYLNIGKFKEEDLLLIWLPRQDQIQEMMVDCFELEDPMEAITFLATHILSELPEDSHYEKAKTPEQLWLAFYMYEKHKEKWDGKEWVK